jgi:hypothetical protein
MIERCTAIVVALAAISSVAMAETQDSKPGKYLCITNHLAGIQYEADGRVSSGNFSPADKTFFLTIAPVRPLEECPSTKMAGHNYWYFCLAKFAVQKNNEPALRGDDDKLFFSLVGGSYLQLNDNMTFQALEGILPDMRGWYVSDGTCTKL